MSVNCRVESRRNTSYQDDKDIKSLMNRFKRACHEANVLHQIKTHQRFIRPCDKRRQKKAAKMLAIKQAGLPKDEGGVS